MVFYYQIRGGPCGGELSHITLRTEDIVCYVGRDKYENEELIKYGWPGDVWFHVEGLSSAHVYFRLNYAVASKFHYPHIPLDGAIPMDLLPKESIEDMMQIVKHNSISGSKLNSCKIVWTPHSNLKKNFDMEAGAVTYHNTKLCRYGRCVKDRERIKALEKSKSIDHTDIDLYQQLKDNERALIDRRKQQRQQRQGGEGEELYDPLEADRLNIANKATRQGDEQSGIDQGMAFLEQLGLTGDAPLTQQQQQHASNNNYTNKQQQDEHDIPLWKQEFIQNENDYPNNETAIFLLERGYPKQTVEQVLQQQKDNSYPPIQALQQLWQGLFPNENNNNDNNNNDSIDWEQVTAARDEEREVLDAIFGEDADWFHDDDNTTNQQFSSVLDVSVPITNYEPPQRYFLQGGTPPPELRFEVYIPKNHPYPFGKQVPVLALVGGGIPQSYLLQLTKQLQQEAYRIIVTEATGEPDPQLFTLISHIGEIWEPIVQEEETATRKAIEMARKAKLAEERRIQQEQAAKMEVKKPTPTATTKFTSEQERREYAASIVAKGYHGVAAAAAKTAATTTATAKGADNTTESKKGGKKFYNTGVSDASLIDDLFS